MDKEELVGIKMRKGLILSKKGGQLTPVPSWKMEEEESGPSNSYTVDRINKTSARKLGACLWEVQNQSLLCNTNVMGKSKARTSEPNSPILPHSTSSRCLTNAYDQHDLYRRINVDSNHQSSALIDNSETSSLDPMFTQRSFSNLNRRSSRYNIKTSAELVRVLNRIWRLEEELASNVSVVKTLKADLRSAHSHIQELTEKGKGHDKLMKAIQSLNNEIEDEKKMRQGLESRNHQLDKELAEVKFLYKKTVNDIESEKNARSLLEEFCDELSRGILEYEQEYRKDTSDQSLHRLSKLWLDERLKMKTVEAHGNKSERNKVVKNMNSEILSYLQTKKCSSSKNDGKEGTVRRQSAESVLFNGTVSAPKEDDDDDSMISNFHCLEFKADSKINKHGLEGPKGKLKAALVCELEKMEGRAENLSNGNKSHLPDNSRGNSSRSVLENSIKDNSLKKKLIEARLEGQNARLRAIKGSVVV